MSDRIQQIEQTLDRVASIVQQMGERAESRFQQHDLELDDHDERIERLERDHAEHADRMAKLEDIQTDIRQILQLMTSRFSGE